MIAGRPVSPGSKLLSFPAAAGKAVALCTYREQLVVAFEYAVYLRTETDGWRPIVLPAPGP